MTRKLLLLASLTPLGACADPAARIAAPDAAPSQDGTVDCRQNGSGDLDCPP
jgi:hypothetical protein